MGGDLERRQVHRQLTEIAACRAKLDYREAVWLLAGKRTRVHQETGHGSYLEYLNVVFGYTAREAKERLMVSASRSYLDSAPRSLRAT